MLEHQVRSKEILFFFDSVPGVLIFVSCIDPHQIIIFGDFNYSYHPPHLYTQTFLRLASCLEESLLRDTQ